MRNYSKYVITKRVYSWIHPFLFCLFFSFPSYSSYYFNTELESAYKEILQLKLSEAKARIATEQVRDPHNGIAIYLRSLAETTGLLFSEDLSEYERLKSGESAYLKLIQSNNLPSSPYHKFCLAEIKLQWAFTQMKFNDEVSAALSTKQALVLLNENLKAFPTFVPTKKSLGLLNIIIGSIPNSHAWLASSLGFKGNVTTGMQMIQEVIDSKTIYLQEGYLIKIITEQYILNRDSNMESMKQLFSRYPNNILYGYIYASILSKHGNSSDALTIIETISVEDNYLSLPFIDYLHGDLLMQQGKYVAARFYFNRYINTFKGKNLLKDATYKLFLSYWLKDEDATAMTYWKSIQTVGQSTFESDKYAQKIALSNELPNKQLAKIRLFTDGGNFTQAFEIYNATNLSDLTTKKDKIEYYYRAARLYQKTGRQNECIQYYKKVISLSAETKNNFYYAPNSSLQLGYIYTQLKNYTVARSYFHQAIAYKNHEYENSIEQKAKIALNEIK
ncbi:tetratricopeptide repeat protein [Cytophaga aurantiaca]|uniref:tetratricopeptide repeat protein n=1 Tax=Cytophaga aurantiaca TaxID=29530 RepID=UPI00037D581D|nr:tetratricopeptide repeat protein [Cytophaga aurantiaca]